MLTIRIKLLKPVSQHKANAVIHATRAELAELKLVNGQDYQVIGTPPIHHPSDLAPSKAENKPSK